MKKTIFKISKAQVSIEFILIVAFVLLISISVLAIFSVKARDISLQNRELAAINVKDTIFHELSIAKSALPGYERELSLPNHLDGLPYSIEIEDNSVLWISISGNDYFYRMPDDAVGVLNFKEDSNNNYNILIKKYSRVTTITNDYACAFDFLQCNGADSNSTNGFLPDCASLNLTFAGVGNFIDECCNSYKRCCLDN